MGKPKTKLKYTHTPPTQDGWYWWKYDPSDNLEEIVEIKNGIIYDRVPASTNTEDYIIRKHTEYTGLWAGPITPPTSHTTDNDNDQNQSQ